MKAATFNPLANSRRASLLLSLIRERQIDLPEDEQELFHEITSLRLAEGSTPGVLKLTTDGSAEGHFDRVMAVMLCAEELMSRPAGSWLGAYAAVLCDECHQAYADDLDGCPRCHPEHGRASRSTATARTSTGSPSQRAGGWRPTGRKSATVATPTCPAGDVTGARGAGRVAARRARCRPCCRGAERYDSGWRAIAVAGLAGAASGGWQIQPGHDRASRLRARRAASPRTVPHDASACGTSRRAGPPRPP